MKEFNKPDEPIEEKPIEQTKKEKRERPYLHLEDVEIFELISTYRKLLRIEHPKEKDLLISKIETLERELRRRNKLANSPK